MEVRCLWPVAAELGEGPLWHAAEGRLYFTDLKRSTLHAWEPASGRQQSWPLPDWLCWLLPRRDGEGFLAGMRDGIAQLRLAPSLQIEYLLRPYTGQAGVRLNDAKADAEGRVYFGVMDDAEASAIGGLHLLGLGGSVAAVDRDYTVTNGPAISPDGRTLYHADSPARTVYAFDRAADGSLNGKRVHLRFDEADGYPDGMTTDAEGGLWVCHWDGARVTRFGPDGRRERVIPLPVSRVTSCVFWGPNLDRLAITTAAHERMDEPLAGALFMAQPGIRGLAPHPARLAL